MIRITRITRSAVEFECDGRKATVQGEGLLRQNGSPDFVIYRNSFDQWDAPNEGEIIDPDSKEQILVALVDAFRERGMKAEIE